MIEEWRDVPDWPEYQVSNLGRVKRVLPSQNGRAVVGGIRQPITLSSGYLAVTLSTKGRGRRLVPIHRLVALAFLGNPPVREMEVNHIDANRGNPRLDNLEWVTRSDNHRHAYRVGYANAKGQANGYSKLTDEAVINIRSLARPDRTNFPDLAILFNVSAATIYDVVSGRTWRHLLVAA